MEAQIRTATRLATVARWTMTACAAHCIITPLAIGLLPMLGLRLVASAWIEWSMIAIAGTLGAAGLGWSYARVHRNARPAVLFTAGMSAIIGANLLFAERDVAHVIVALCGAAVIFAAGRLNHTLAHRH